MPMTDAPNFVAKFGWRKPCPRYIGPLLRTASVASVGRGDHTLPPQILAQNLAGGSHTPGAPRRQAAQPPVGGGLRPAPLEEVPSCANSRWFRNTTPYRVGADLCVRRTRLFAGPAHGPTRRSAPTDPNAASINLWKPGGDRVPPHRARLPCAKGAVARRATEGSFFPLSAAPFVPRPPTLTERMIPHAHGKTLLLRPLPENLHRPGPHL